MQIMVIEASSDLYFASVMSKLEDGRRLDASSAGGLSIVERLRDGREGLVLPLVAIEKLAYSSYSAGSVSRAMSLHVKLSYLHIFPSQFVLFMGAVGTVVLVEVI